MHYYPHNIPDFNNSTRHLTRVERSVYRDAIERYYDTESVLTKDINALEKRLLCITDEEKTALKSILEEFFILTDDGYFHERCNDEITKYRANISAKAIAGKASALARKQKSTKVKQKSTHVERTLNSVDDSLNKLRTNNQELITNITNSPQQAGDAIDISICPHKDIINLYTKHLPVGIQPKIWNESRQASLRARWREDSKRQNLDWWDGLFSHISKSNFLTGKVPNREGRVFEISLDWIINPSNFAKIIEGKYDNRDAA